MKYHKQLFYAMGSPCALHYYADANDAEHIANKLVAEVKRLENKYSRYLDGSVASKINRVARQGGSINLDSETSALLDYAEIAWQQSDGLFDITSGLLRKAWNYKQANIPIQAQLDELLPRIGWNKVRWEAPSLAFEQLGMELDFGGYVKEYAADCVAALAQNLKIEHGLVELGGDIRVIGRHLDGRPWAIGIRHPRKENSVLATIELLSGAIASSGDYERCIVHSGKRYGHVLNPRTGWPVQGLMSATVVAEHCLLAGTTSTLALLKGEQGEGWLTQQGLPWLAMDDTGNLKGSIQAEEQEA